MIKTFRGQLGDGGQDRIRLSTIKGKVGYRIVKFQIMAWMPFNDDQASLATIWKVEQSSVPLNSPEINFTDSNVLAAATLKEKASISYTAKTTVIFDREIFNQDIYITHTEHVGTATLNYYIELEVIPLDDKGAEYMTIKDLRTRGF